MPGQAANRNTPRVVYGSASLPPGAPSVVVLGNFDGVHRGHQALLARARQAAKRHQAEVVVYTFDPHPARVLAPDRAPAALSTTAQKLALLGEYGADVVVVESFTHEFAAQSADAFVQDILLQRLRARAVVVGYDFTYGVKRSGTVDALRQAGADHGFGVDVVAPVTYNDAPISSSRVRALIAQGELADARACLGHRYAITGNVVRGKQRGRTLGFPTANIASDLPLLLPTGVYACTLRTDGATDAADGNREHFAVASLGYNPTFSDVATPILEVHILDWDGNLYGQNVSVSFWQRLREEARFESLEALVAQIHSDIAASRTIFADATAQC